MSDPFKRARRRHCLRQALHVLALFALWCALTVLVLLGVSWIVQTGAVIYAHP